MGLKRVGHNWATFTFTFIADSCCIPETNTTMSSNYPLLKKKKKKPIFQLLIKGKLPSTETAERTYYWLSWLETTFVPLKSAMLVLSDKKGVRQDVQKTYSNTLLTGHIFFFFSQKRKINFQSFICYFYLFPLQGFSYNASPLLESGLWQNFNSLYTALSCLHRINQALANNVLQSCGRKWSGRSHGVREGSI